MTGHLLRGRSIEDLERLYAESTNVTALSGRFVGTFLGFIENRGTRRPFVRGVDSFLFDRMRFGMDFHRSRWWFFHPDVLSIADFRATFGPSRWRATDVLRIEYDVWRNPIRGMLYDEVKPLGPDVALGLGGINAGPNEGDHFFFELHRMP